MYRTFFKTFSLLALLFVAGFYTACQQEDTATDVDNFVDTSVSTMQEGCGAGIHGCYELVFPVSIQFADSSVVAVASYEDLRTAIRTWYETNGGHPGHGNRPTLVFPFQVVNAAGEIITVENATQLAELKDLCSPNPGGGGNGGGGNGGPGGHGGHGGGHGDACFTLVYPLTIGFPDSTQVTVNSEEEFHTAVHDWKKNNPTSTGRPEFVFPVTVLLKDGTQVVVNSAEELKAIKDACRG